MSFSQHEQDQAQRWYATTPAERLHWLERSKRFVRAALAQAARQSVALTSKDKVVCRPWGQGCKAYPLFDSDRLAVVEEHMPAGSAETPHLHGRAQQFFYVLEGTLEVEVCRCIHTLSARQGLAVPAGLEHTVRNTSEADVWFLVVSEPSTRSDRIDIASGS